MLNQISVNLGRTKYHANIYLTHPVTVIPGMVFFLGYLPGYLISRKCKKHGYQWLPKRILVLDEIWLPLVT